MIHAHTFTHSLSLTLTLSLTHPYTHSLHSHHLHPHPSTHTLPHSPTLTYCTLCDRLLDTSSHIYTHTHPLTPTHTLTHTHSHSLTPPSVTDCWSGPITSPALSITSPRQRQTARRDCGISARMKASNIIKNRTFIA